MILSVAGVLAALEAVLTIFRWLWAHGIELLAAVGTMSALGKALEVAVRKALEVRPKNKFLIVLAKALDFHEGVTGVFIKALDIISFTREDVLKKHGSK